MNSLHRLCCHQTFEYKLCTSKTVNRSVHNMYYVQCSDWIRKRMFENLMTACKQAINVTNFWVKYLLSYSINGPIKTLYPVCWSWVYWLKNHIKIFSKSIKWNWAMVLFGWFTFKIVCNNPVLHSRWVPLQRKELSTNANNKLILSLNQQKFEFQCVWH